MLSHQANVLTTVTGPSHNQLTTAFYRQAYDQENNEDQTHMVISP